MTRRTKLRIWNYFTPADRDMLVTSAAAVDLRQLEHRDLQQLIDDMAKTMKQADGIGLAAPQIGQSIRLALIEGSLQGAREPVVLVNPSYTVIGSASEDGEEGCLSIPKVFGIVPRAVMISVKAFDRHGQPIAFQAQDLFARVIQHETDHLNGVLFITRTNRFTKGGELLS